jgi:DNA repair exonuclease SbcCD ATPase subunit
MTLLLLSKKPSSLTMCLVAALLLVAPPLANAVEVAPRISDREIIESLAELKAGQKALEARMDQRFEAVDQRFDAFQQQIDQRFDAVNRRFETVDQRFASVDEQLDKIWTLMLVMITGIFGLIGYIVWDRKTALRPVEQRLIALEAEFHRDLEIQHEDGSRLTRLVKVLREMAKSDEKLANVLRSFSLL